MGNSDAVQPARLVSALVEIKRKCPRVAHSNGIFSDFLLRDFSLLVLSLFRTKSLAFVLSVFFTAIVLFALDLFGLASDLH